MNTDKKRNIVQFKQAVNFISAPKTFGEKSQWQVLRFLRRRIFWGTTIVTMAKAGFQTKQPA